MAKPRGERTPGGVIAAVLAHSVGDEVGLEPGDRLLSINGHALRDILDYRYYSAEENLVLVIEREGQRHRLEIERDYDEDLGIEFAQPLFDGLRQCNNRCPFCFVQQMPRGLRSTLYLHDDDYRYSFLQGSYVTLTNLTEDDWQRVAEQHLSPLYVSVHATDLQVRRKVLGNPEAPDILAQLRRLAEMGIRVHGQIVISPGMNDGEVLRRSIEATAALWPTVRTLAIVPVGLTRYQQGCVRPLGTDEAVAVLGIVAQYASEIRQQLGCTWLYPSDELFLLAGQPIPPSAFYDDDAQHENGVGLVRILLDDWLKAKRRARTVRSGVSRITLVCGTLIAPLLNEMAAEFGALAGLEAEVVPVVNRLFGEMVTVSGLLTGNDVLAALRERELGQYVFLPRAMFDSTGRLTLDDLTLDAMRERLGVPVSTASAMSEVIGARHLRARASR